MCLFEIKPVILAQRGTSTCSPTAEPQEILSKCFGSQHTWTKVWVTSIKWVLFIYCKHARWKSLWAAVGADITLRFPRNKTSKILKEEKWKHKPCNQTLHCWLRDGVELCEYFRIFDCSACTHCSNKNQMWCFVLVSEQSGVFACASPPNPISFEVTCQPYSHSGAQLFFIIEECDRRYISNLLLGVKTE